MNEVTKITITKPDDWHLHIRDGEQMESVIGFTAQQFGRAIIMPNLKPPITTVAEMFAYQKRILDVCKKQDVSFDPLMTLYLTDNTTAKEIRTAKASGVISGCKLYPAGATTNSNAGVTDVEKIYPIFAVMEEVGMPLLIHGEVTDPDVDIFDRERIFIEKHLFDIVNAFPGLKTVLEHVTTKDGVDFVRGCGMNITATITAHHLLINRNDLFVGGIRPHNYCLPVAKRGIHRQYLLHAALNSKDIFHPKFFLGTDSAPHAQISKENACGCAGCFTAPHALALYATAFEQYALENNIEDWPKRLEQFASFNGPKFYNLEPNTQTITLIKEDWAVPEEYPYGKHPGYPIGRNRSQPNDADYSIIPFYANETLPWRLE